MKNIKTIAIIFLLINHSACNQQTKRLKDTSKQAQTIEDDRSYDNTYKPGGTFETAIVLHSRMGIRIELNLDRCNLELWISPQAGKSIDYRLRNFSCRDDHTNIFDKIWFPELQNKKFIRCDYDPFHSIVYFENQTMHIASLLDKPAVIVWFEQEEVVDFKSDKQDSLLTQEPKCFGVRHPDRGLTFDFFAAIGDGKSAFQHQPEVDRGRSIYARTLMQSKELLVIGGELKTENVKSIITGIAQQPLQLLLNNNETKIARETASGSLILKNVSVEMQKFYNINQRHLLSAQDASGAIRAALRYVYYLIWATDGTVTSTSICQSGNANFLNHWLEFLLANPTVQKAPPAGGFYGQLVNGRITKREEFGSLCAVMPAFMYWGMTGDNRFVSGEYLKVLEDAVDWLERYCYDAKEKAIGTYYIGGGSEDPFYGSNDFGYDAAVGAFMDRNCYYPTFQNKPIQRVYEYNMNLNQYNIYMMLASVTEGSKSEEYLKKAAIIERFLCRLDSLNAIALYQVNELGLVQIKRKEEDKECGLFAIQNVSPAFFKPDFPRLFMNQMKSFKPLPADSLKNKFCNTVYGRLAGLDIEFVDEKGIISSLENSLPYHLKISPYNPMPYTMVEMFGAEAGTFHDIRPQAFSSGTFQPAVTNLAVRTMPFGIALRGTNYIQEIYSFDYLNGSIDIKYTGSGKLNSILLNGKKLENTYQIPDTLIKKGKNLVEIELKPNQVATTELIYSTVRLADVKTTTTDIIYSIRGYCQNVLIFKNLKGAAIIKNSKGQIIDSKTTQEDGFVFIEFKGKDRFTVEIKK